MTAPMCGTHECNQGRGAVCTTGCAEILAAQAEGARMCGAWPYTGTPTSPGPLTEAELDAHNRDFHSHMVVIDSAGHRVFAHSGRIAPAIFGPYRRATWWRKLWARWREWKADRMWPKGVAR